MRIDYYLTQFLSGHGHFRTHTKRFKITASDLCLYYGLTNSLEHAIITCNRWEQERCRLTLELGEVVNRNNVVGEMLESANSWRNVHTYIMGVMGDGERIQRELKRADA